MEAQIGGNGRRRKRKAGFERSASSLLSCTHTQLIEKPITTTTTHVHEIPGLPEVAGELWVIMLFVPYLPVLQQVLDLTPRDTPVPANLLQLYRHTYHTIHYDKR